MLYFNCILIGVCLGGSLLGIWLIARKASYAVVSNNPLAQITHPVDPTSAHATATSQL